jgi:hypothetical protein
VGETRKGLKGQGKKHFTQRRGERREKTISCKGAEGKNISRRERGERREKTISCKGAEEKTFHAENAENAEKNNFMQRR